MASISKQKKDTKFKPYHVQFAEQVISMLEAGTAPWQKPWKGGELYAPHNDANGTRYRGINRLVLSWLSDMRYGGEPRYMTLPQANELGYRVKKGEHAQSVVYWEFTKTRDRLDENGKPVMGPDGKPEQETVPLERPRVRYFRVFNVSQLENEKDKAPYPSLDDTRPRFAWNPEEKAEAVLKASGAVIEHRKGNRAYYSPSEDKIVLPNKDQFPEPAGYYGTALHELGHWTGHESRLDRDIRHSFGSSAYAREELRAEIASWMMGQDLGIAHDPDQHAAYVADWIESLKKDPYEIVRAANDAEKIKEYVMGLEQRQEQKQTQQNIREDALLRQKIEKLKEEQARLIGISQETPDWAEELDIINVHISALTMAMDQGKEFPPYLKSIEYKYVTSESLIEEFEDFVKNLSTFQAEWKIYEEILSLQAQNEDSILLNLYTSTILDALAYRYSCLLGDLPFEYKNREEAASIYFLHEKYKFLLHERNIEKDTQNLDIINQKIIITRSSFEVLINNPKLYYTDFWPKMYLSDGELLEDTNENLQQRINILSEEYGQFLSPQTKESLSRMARKERDTPKPEIAGEDTWLSVPYEEKNIAKKAGARWNPEKSLWYAPAGTDLTSLKKWLPASLSAASPNKDPREEFAAALAEAGLDLRGELPEMDGKLHRVALTDRPHGRDGAYVGYLDGRPSGYIQNFVTGEKTNWKASGHRLTETQLAQLRTEATQRRHEREAERQAEQNRVARQCAEIFEQRHLAASNHPYLVRKDVLPHGIKESPDGRKLIIPLRNIRGEIRTVQIINEDGDKFFEKGGQKRGCFHLLGGEEKLKKQGRVFLAEGYATAASLYEATGRPVAACMDSANLEPVAKALREKYPNLQITVCADNDVKNAINVGVAKAKQAAEAVKGCVAVPRFTPEEENRGMKDFNDLRLLHGDKAVKETVLHLRQAREVTR